MKQKHILSVLVFVVTAFGSISLKAQLDVQSFQQLRLERQESPGTFIILEPPATSITSYSLVWPSEPPPPNSFLTVVSTSAPFQLGWSTPTGYLLETVSSRNLRRNASSNQGGLQGNVGTNATDLQGSRTLASQSALGDESIIMGGAQNGTFSGGSGEQAAVGGGFSNLAFQRGVVLGGNNNTVSEYEGTVLGGKDNTASGDNRAVVLGGEFNTASGNHTLVLGGSNNTASGSGAATVFSGFNNNSTGYISTIMGGFSNTASSNYATIFGGSNNSMSGQHGGIVAGQSNTGSNNQTFIGAGTSNTVNSSNPNVIIVGTLNDATAGYCLVATGNNNNTNTNHTTILFGASNNITNGQHTVIGGGRNNTISNGNFSAIIGGTFNAISQQYAYIMGGTNGTVSNQNALLFNAGPEATGNNTSNTVQWNNINLIFPTNTGATVGLCLFENNSTTTLPAGTINYVRFVGPDSITSDVDNEYTFPSVTSFTATNVFQIAASPSPSSTSATISMASALADYAVATTNANAATTNIANTLFDPQEVLKVNPNNNPASRRITLANGQNDGFVLTIQVYNATAGNGVRLLDADANLRLNGDAALSQYDTITLVWDATTSAWFELGRTNN